MPGVIQSLGWRGRLASAHVSATLSRVVPLALDANMLGNASTAGLASLSGGLTGFLNVAGSVASTAAAAATLAAILALGGATAGAATVSGELQPANVISGSTSGDATTAGTLNAVLALAGSADGSALAEGSFTAATLSGSTSGAATTAGDVSMIGALTGTASGSATSDSILSILVALAGSSSGDATISGSLLAPALTDGTATGAATVSGALNPAGMAGTADGSATLSGSLSLVGALAGSSAGTATTDAELLAPGFSGSTAGTATVSGTLLAPELTAGSSAGTASTSGSLEAPGLTSGTADGTASTSGALEPATSIAGSSAGTATVSADLNAVLALAGSESGTGTTSGSLNAALAASGSADGSATVSGAIEAPALTGGTAAGTGSTSADLNAALAMAGSESGTATTAGSLNILTDLAGSSAGTGTPSADLNAALALAGSSAGTATTDGALEAPETLFILREDATALMREAGTEYMREKAPSDLSASITGTGSTSGELNAVFVLAGSESGTATVTGDLHGGIALAGSSDGTATTSGDLAAPPVSLSGSSDGTATTSGDLNALFDLAGSVSGTGTPSADLQGGIALSGSSSGSATTTAAFATTETPLVAINTQGSTYQEVQATRRGFRFKPLNAGLVIKSLGRLKHSGNSQTHLVAIVDWSTKADVASVTVDMTNGNVGDFVYVDLGTPVELVPNKEYALVSDEASGGDTLLDKPGTTVTPDASITVLDAAYYIGSTWNTVGTTNEAYGVPGMMASALGQPAGVANGSASCTGTLTLAPRIYTNDYISLGTVANGTNTASPSYPSAIGPSDLSTGILCIICGRHVTANTAATMPAGWTQLAVHEDGTGTWAADAGTRRVEIWQKDSVTGDETGSITVGWNAGSSAQNTLYTRLVRFKYHGSLAASAAVTAADTSHNTSVSFTPAGTLSLAAGDAFLWAAALCSDTADNSTGISTTASGITFGGAYELMNGGTNSGYDTRGHAQWRIVDSGSGTVSPTISWTASANTSGACVMLRLRAS